jgi:hypothetical protein
LISGFICAAASELIAVVNEIAKKRRGILIIDTIVFLHKNYRKL